MGCSNSCCLSDKQEQVVLCSEIDITNFNIEDFPVFEKNFYYMYVQNIKIVYSELLFDNDRPINKLHKIFITRDYIANTTLIIQIEVLNGNLY